MYSHVKKLFSFSSMNHIYPFHQCKNAIKITISAIDQYTCNIQQKETLLNKIYGDKYTQYSACQHNNHSLW